MHEAAQSEPTARSEKHEAYHTQLTIRHMTRTALHYRHYLELIVEAIRTWAQRAAAGAQVFKEPAILTATNQKRPELNHHMHHER